MERRQELAARRAQGGQRTAQAALAAQQRLLLGGLTAGAGSGHADPRVVGRRTALDFAHRFFGQEDGRTITFNYEFANAAVTDAEQSGRIDLLVRRGKLSESVAVEYAGGYRCRHFQPIECVPRRLNKILAPLIGAVGEAHP